ncbi:hypothetical protein ABPG72_018728 [Tetrahymena utriculariae]
MVQRDCWQNITQINIQLTQINQIENIFDKNETQILNPFEKELIIGKKLSNNTACRQSIYRGKHAVELILNPYSQIYISDLPFYAIAAQPIRQILDQGLQTKQDHSQNARHQFYCSLIKNMAQLINQMSSILLSLNNLSSSNIFLMWLEFSNGISYRISSCLSRLANMKDGRSQDTINVAITNNKLKTILGYSYLNQIQDQQNKTYIVYVGHFQQSNSTNSSMIKLDVIRCQSPQLQNMNCFDFSKVPNQVLTLGNINQILSSINLYVYRCQDVDTNKKFIPNNCAEEQQINQLINKSKFFLNVKIKTSQFNTTSQEIQDQYRSQLSIVTTSNSQIIDFRIQNQITTVKKGFFIQTEQSFASPISYTTQSITYNRQQLIQDSGFKFLTQIYFEIDENITYFHIQYPMFTEILALCNSTLALMIFLCSFCRQFAKKIIRKDIFFALLQNIYTKTYIHQLKSNNISAQNQQIQERQIVSSDQKIEQIQNQKYERERQEEEEEEQQQQDGNTRSEEKMEAESKNDILIPQFQPKLSQQFTNKFLSQKIMQNTKENREDNMKQQHFQTKPNSEEIEFKKQDNLSDLTYQQPLNFQNSSYLDQIPNLIRFDSYQKNPQLHSSDFKEKLIQNTSSTFKQNKTKQKLIQPNKTKSNQKKTLNNLVIQEIHESLQMLNGKQFSQESEKNLSFTKYKRRDLFENKELKRKIEQQIDDSLDFLKIFKEVLFLKKAALILLSKDQLAAIQLVGLNIEDIEPNSHKIQNDLQGNSKNIEGPNSKKLNEIQQEAKSFSQSKEQQIGQDTVLLNLNIERTTKMTGAKLQNIVIIKKIDQNLGKARNGSSSQPQKKTTKKESQKNYITIVKTNSTQNVEKKTQAQTPNNISANIPEQIKTQLGIKQVQSQNALSATSLKTIESPLQQDTIPHILNLQPNKGVSMFANLTQQQPLVNPSQSQNQVQYSQTVENSQNIKQNQSSPNKYLQNSQIELTYLQEYQQYLDYYNSNQTPYYAFEEVTTPQQNNSYQIDEHLNAISALKSKEISMVSNNESYQNLNEQNKLNKNEYSSKVNLNQSNFPFQQYNQQIQQTSQFKNTNQLSQLLQQNSQNQIQNNSNIYNNNQNIQADNRIQQTQLQSYLLKSNQIQVQIMNNMNRQPLFNHVTDNQLLKNSSQLNQENQYHLSQKQLSEINLKKKDHQEGNQGLPNVSQIAIQKRWEVFDLPFKNTIASLISEKGETYIYKFDPQGPLPELTKYKLNYKFTNIPCPNIAIDQKNGRLFVYDNDGNLLVFSQDLEFNEGKPIIKLSLEERFSRKNPTLFVKTYDNYTLAFVIGGFFRQQTYSNIKVFKIERRNASIRYELSINMMKRRRNPIVFSYSLKNSVNINSSVQNKNAPTSGKLNSTHQNVIETEKEYLILLGGNSYDPESDANITGEYIEIDKIHKLINQRSNLSIDITDLIKTKLHSSFDDAYEISAYLTQGYIVTWHNEEQERTKLLIFQEKLKNVLEIKKIDLDLSKVQNYGILDIVYSDIIHKGHKGLMRIEQDYLSYFNQKGQDIHIISLKNGTEVYSTYKKTNFFKPKGIQNNTLSNLVQQKNQDEEEVEEESEDEEMIQAKKQQENEESKKLQQKKQVEETKKDSAKNIDVKDTKEQSQSLSDRKNGITNNLSPENILSNNKLLSYDQNPFIESKREYKEEELKQLAESERQKKEEEDNKKDKDDQKKEQGEEEDEEEEDQEKIEKNKKKLKNKKQKQNVISKSNKFCKCKCNCNIFQMSFFL